MTFSEASQTDIQILQLCFPYGNLNFSVCVCPGHGSRKGTMRCRKRSKESREGGTAEGMKTVCMEAEEGTTG